MKPIRLAGIVVALLTLLGIQWPTVAQNPDYALRFDGLSDFVRLSSTASMLGAGWPTTKTVSLWVKPTGSPFCGSPDAASCDAIFGDRPRTFGISRGSIGGNDRIWVFNFDGSPDRIGIEYAIDEWIHVALVHGGGFLKAYKNGALIGTVPSGPTYQGGDTVLHLGGIINSSTKNWTFEGEIDELQLWNVARNDAEILQGAYSSLAGSEAGLAAYYRMSDGAGTTLTDDSGHSWTGTLNDGGSGVPADGPITWVPSGALGDGSGPVNEPPVADPQNVTLAEDTAAAVTLTGSDPDGNPLTFRVVSQPSHGLLSGASPSLVYTPAADFHGSDSFSFVANDGWVDSTVETVVLTVTQVNDPPIAADDVRSTPVDTSVVVRVLANDVDVDGDALTIASVESPFYGTVTNNGSDLDYAPNPGVTGSDTFNYTVSDSRGGVASSKVTITIGQTGGSGGGSPILIIEHASNPFGGYYAEILRTEGLNEFDVLNISDVAGAVLAEYDLALLGEMPLTGDQAAMLADWVYAGGQLIAMRPDPQLAGLLGLTDLSSTLSNAYLQIDAASAAGSGIVHDTLQFHGIASLYSLNGATALATLFTDASTPTTSPAVSIHSVGANGGQAAAFAFDLARSVVYTRQGNPEWAGQVRNPWVSHYTALDLFYPDWIDFDKIAIPQADEQQRFLANLVSTMNLPKKPLPRFWYFPRNEKAVVMLTGDDHNGYLGTTYNGNTTVFFDNQKARSPAGCSVEDWECIRSTSYVYLENPMTDAQAAVYTAQGFEIGLHINPARNESAWCYPWTAASLLDDYQTQLSGFYAKYLSLPKQASERTHCYDWFAYADQPAIQATHRIRMDTNVAYWPGKWVENRPGFMLGSVMPMRFADSSGSTIDVYQAHTIITDDNGRVRQEPILHINTLLDRALGVEGYYGVFTVLAHSDRYYNYSYRTANDIIDAAIARGVPVVSGRQLVTWLDARNASAFQSLSWDGSRLSFHVLYAQGANGLRAMLPANGPAGRISQIARDGAPVIFTTELIKGLEYAIFEAHGGDYTADYASP